MQETAPMLAPWRDLAPLVVQLGKADARVIQCLALAPPRAFHSYAAWLRSRSAVDPAAMAHELRERSPKALLAQALGHEQPQPMWRSLDRLQVRAQDMETYLVMDQLSRGAFGGVLAQFEEITEKELAFVQELECEAEREPLLVPAAPALAKCMDIEAPLDIDDFKNAMRVLRLTGQVSDEAAWHRHLGAARTGGSLARMLGRRMRNIRLSEIDTTGSDLRCATRISDFMQMASRYRNCLKHSHQLMASAIAGQLLLLEHVAEPLAVITLEIQARTQQGLLLVRISQMRGVGNALLGPAAETVAEKIRVLPGLIMTRCRMESLLRCVMCRDDKQPEEPDARQIQREMAALMLDME